MSRILIVSVSAGAGHLQAAAAVETALAETHPEIEARNVDILRYASAAYRHYYGKTYLAIVRGAPALWGMLYGSTARQEARTAGGKLRMLIDRSNTRPFQRFLKAFAPEAVLATHFMPAAVLAREKAKGRLDAFLGVTLTDHDLHAFWLYDRIDRYYAPDAEIAHVLARRGVADERIRVTGIPVRPAFARLPDPASVRSELGLPAGDGAGPVVLLASGGFGVGDVPGLVRAAFDAAAGRPVGVLVVCGRNRRLERRVRALEVPANARLVVFGFTERMHELMAAADLAVTKPGGLTTSECLAAGLPMLVVAPIPGQEEGNRDYLLEAGAAATARTVESLEWKLQRLLFEEPAALARMREAASRLGRPRAAYEVAEDLAGT